MRSIIVGLAGLLVALACLGARAADSTAPGTGAGPAQAPGALASPASIPVAAFFDTPVLWAPIPSPDGSHLAVLMRNAQGRRVLAVLDLTTLKNPIVVGAIAGSDIGWADWVNDRRLVFERTFENGVTSSHSPRAGLFAVDLDGGNFRVLVRPDGYDNEETGTHIKSRMLTADNIFLRTLDDGSDDVIVGHIVGKWSGGSETRSHFEFTGLVPMRLNTRTGITQNLLDKIPDNADDWMIDDRGQVRGVMASADGKTRWLQPTADGQWKELAKFNSYGESKGAFSFLDVGADGKLYARHSVQGTGETDGLFTLDETTGRVEPQAILAIDGFDFGGELVQDACQHRVLGVRYTSDADDTHWFDPAMQELQKRVDAKLPGRINTLDRGRCDKSTHVVVTSASDRVPDEYYLFDSADGSVRKLASSRPGIDPRLMGRMDFHRIKTGDGRSMPVYVTTPLGKGPWPAIVLVHGGPNVRGWDWRWDPEAQFYASRGYVVVMPEFRGSAGYGWDWESAGFKQWGLTMQDDIADATRWAAAQGLADPRRTCIAGGSYGGYATLMGLIRYPDLYRCGIALAAVADITMMYDTWWSDQSDEWRGYGMPVMVGDRDKDAAQFAATSPLKLAARLTRPLFLAHGTDDHRVPVEQAQALRDALTAAHAPLTWQLYVDEGHGLSASSDRADYYTRVEAFLRANDGPLPPASSAQ